MNEIHVTISRLDSGDLAIKFPYDPLLVEKVKAMPQRRWVPGQGHWSFKPTQANIDFVQKWFPHADWNENTFDLVADMESRKRERQEVQSMKGEELDQSLLKEYTFFTNPFDHQKTALLLSKDKTTFAYLMDQGTGKTKVLLDDIVYNYKKGRINAAIIICKNSVKTNWVDPSGFEDEVEKHIHPDIPINKGCFLAGRKKREREIYNDFLDKWEGDYLHILAVNYESISHERIYKECLSFVQKHRTYICIDESTGIKNRSTKRTKNCVRLRKQCPIARIATGTVIIKSPLNAYSQFNFLDPDILGYGNYYSFQNHFAQMGGFEGYQVLFYKNLDELSAKIDSCSYRVLKKDCLDLPPKMYDKRKITLNAEQSKAYAEMRENLVASISEEEVVTAPIVLTQLLRLQQITSGFLPRMNDLGEVIETVPLGAKNPKIEEVIDIVNECQHKVIVWCRFIAEIELLARRFDEEAIGFVAFHGAVSETGRAEARRSFQDPKSNVKVFLGQVNTGGMGITLTEARTVVYCSNSFSTEDRVQSEDRAHRIGQEHSVEYIDLIVPGTIDVKIISTLRSNKKISDEVLKDGVQTWI